MRQMRRGVLLVVLAVAFGLYWSARARRRGETLAATECPFGNTPRVMMNAGIAPSDTLPVRVHEAIHAEQCRRLGPVSYRVRNLTGAGKLSLEVPAYCAAAKARVQQGEDVRRARERLFDDIHAAFAGLIDSAVVDASVRAACPEVVRS